MSVRAEARNFVTHLLAHELLARAARVLAAGGIPVMPLKGVWLQAWVYDPPDSRPLTDVDILVPEVRYADALAQLQHAGFVPAQSNVSEAALQHPQLPLQLDVHRRLFMPGAFALPTHEMFSRARRDSVRFGAEVWSPDPIDVLCHLVGHFAKSRAQPEGSRYHRDFTALLDGLELAPERCAARLTQAGMARACRYAFAYNVGAGHARSAQVVASLPHDPLAEVLCKASRAVAAHARPGDLRGALPGYLLDRSLFAGLGGAVRRSLTRT